MRLPDGTAGDAPVDLSTNMVGTHYFDVLGRRIELVSGRSPAEAGRSFEIVGVVADSHYYDLVTEPDPLVYFPVAQRPLVRMTVMVRADGAVPALADDLRRVLSQERSEVAVIELAPLAEQIRRSLWERP